MSEEGKETSDPNLKDRVRARVLELLLKHEPNKVDRIDAAMAKFEGHEMKLLEYMTDRYHDWGKEKQSGETVPTIYAKEPLQPSAGKTDEECEADNPHSDATEHWQYLPKELQQLVLDFAAEEISLDNLVMFWQEIVKLQPLGSNKEFDLDAYTRLIQSRLSSYIIALDCIMNDRDTEAVYLMFWGTALTKGIFERGPDHVLAQTKKKSKQKRKLSKNEILCTYNHWFRKSLIMTRCEANIVEHMNEQLRFLIGKQLKGRDRLEEMLSKVEPEEEYAIHLVQSAIPEEEIQRAYGGQKPRMIIQMKNKDNHEWKKPLNWHCDKDVTLGWMLKDYVIRGIHHHWIEGPNITPNTKYYRILHNGRTIFLSSSSKKTLQELGINHGDEITVGGVGIASPSRVLRPKQIPSGNNSKPKKSNASKKRQKKKKRNAPAAPALSEEQLTKRYRESHSRALTRVLEEMSPKLQEIRNHLNALSLHKEAPKERRLCSKKEQVQPSSVVGSLDNSFGGKAGKVVYPILVGESTSLYKTNKSIIKKNTITLDLHKLTKDEALKKLDESLPAWVNTAMKGEYPWVIPVDIICGGGSQTLSDVVKEWIRHSHRVANRQKNLI